MFLLISVNKYSLVRKAYPSINDVKYSKSESQRAHDIHNSVSSAVRDRRKQWKLAYTSIHPT